jgi:drug/metabolite transporter superfamily protein YnfA
MRVPLVGVGIGLIVVGGVFILQGLGVLEGSFMTDEATWGWIGAVCVLVGLAVLARGLRRSGP